MAPAFMRPLSLPHCEGEFPLISKMNATSASTDALPDALLAAFISFPAPLALLDAQGRTTLVNSRFRSQFSESAPAAAALRTLAQNPDGIWQSIPLAPLEGRNPDAMHLPPLPPTPTRAWCAFAPYAPGRVFCSSLKIRTQARLMRNWRQCTRISRNSKHAPPPTT